MWQHKQVNPHTKCKKLRLLQNKIHKEELQMEKIRRKADELIIRGKLAMMQKKDGVD